MARGQVYLLLFTVLKLMSIDNPKKQKWYDCHWEQCKIKQGTWSTGKRERPWLVKAQHLIGSVEWREFSGPITNQSDRHKSNAIEYWIFLQSFPLWVYLQYWQSVQLSRLHPLWLVVRHLGAHLCHSPQVNRPTTAVEGCERNFFPLFKEIQKIKLKVLNIYIFFIHAFLLL